jgi:hypothetical protein
MSTVYENRDRWCCRHNTDLSVHRRLAVDKGAGREEWNRPNSSRTRSDPDDGTFHGPWSPLVNKGGNDMAELLGIGLTHYPGPIARDEHMAGLLRRTLQSSSTAPELRDVASWPQAMQDEWGDDEGTRAAGEHRARLVNAFRRLRKEIEDFAPDFILIWGDDQYENFREDIIPPFCVYIVDEVDCTPFRATEKWSLSKDNYWGDPPDTVFKVRGHENGAKYLTRGLSEAGFDIPYAYRTRHEKGLAHSFTQTMLFLDYDRTGLDIPVVPFHVNCYGSDVIRSRGGAAHLDDPHSQPDPPGPTPEHCFNVGRATARLLAASPWRVAVIGSSSWSHAFLTAKNRYLYPDFDSDRARYDELRTGRFSEWDQLQLPEMEQAGQHELLNWVCLAGAMTELNASVEIIDYVETYVFNSDKCFAVFRPQLDEQRMASA